MNVSRRRASSLATACTSVCTSRVASCGCGRSSAGGACPIESSSPTCAVAVPPFAERELHVAVGGAEHGGRSPGGQAREDAAAGIGFVREVGAAGRRMLHAAGGRDDRRGGH